jgi:hypothetical protein
MVIYISEPIKKEKNYIAKIRNETNKQIRIKVPDTIFMSLAPLASGGRTMRIYLNDTDIVNNISAIDDEARQLTIENNQDWFNNNLDANTINALFRNSINKTNNTMLVLISDTNDPSIYINGTRDDEFNINTIVSKTPLTLILEAQGLMIYPKKFGIRWIIRSIYIMNENSEDLQDHELIDKEMIEESWKSDINEIENKLDNDINALESRIQELNNIKAYINTSYEKALAEKSITNEWHDLLNSITKRYSAYLNGTL